MKLNSRLLLAKVSTAIEINKGKPILLMTDSVFWEGHSNMLPQELDDASKETDKKYIVRFFDWIGGFMDRPVYKGHDLLLDNEFKQKFIELYCTKNAGPYDMGYELNKQGKEKYGVDYASIDEIKENVIY